MKSAILVLFLFQLTLTIAFLTRKTEKEKKDLNDKVAEQFPQVVQGKPLSWSRDNQQTLREVLSIAEGDQEQLSFFYGIPGVSAGYLEGGDREAPLKKVVNEFAPGMSRGINKVEELPNPEAVYDLLGKLAAKYRDVVQQEWHINREIQALPIALKKDGSIVVAIIHPLEPEGLLVGVATFLIKV